MILYDYRIKKNQFHNIELDSPGSVVGSCEHGNEPDNEKYLSTEQYSILRTLHQIGHDHFVLHYFKFIIYLTNSLTQRLKY